MHGEIQLILYLFVFNLCVLPNKEFQKFLFTVSVS